MEAYRRVYDSRHLQADAKNRDQLRNPTLGNRVWATFAFNAFKARLDKIWLHQTVKFDFTADLTGTSN